MVSLYKSDLNTDIACMFTDVTLLTEFHSTHSTAEYGEPSILAEFLEEATIMKDFQHPNVLSLVAVVFIKVMPYVILPLAEHGDLRSFIVNPDIVNSFVKHRGKINSRTVLTDNSQQFRDMDCKLYESYQQGNTCSILNSILQMNLT